MKLENTASGSVEQRRQRPLPEQRQSRRRTHPNPPLTLPLSASTALRNCSTAKQDRLMADLASAKADRQTAVGGNTLDNETRAWNRYSEYCRSIGLGDNLFLEDMSQTHRIEIIGGFPMTVHQEQFSRPRDAPLAESTVSDTLNHVAAVFRENGHNDPKRDAERYVARLLRRQLRSYKKDDPKEVQQKALPVCILHLILSSKSTELRQAMGKLARAAHFWVMRSC